MLLYFFVYSCFHILLTMNCIKFLHELVNCDSNEKGHFLSMYSNKKDDTNGDYNYLVNCVVICCECLAGIIVLSMAVERDPFCSHPLAYIYTHTQLHTHPCWMPSLKTSNFVLRMGGGGNLSVGGGGGGKLMQEWGVIWERGTKSYKSGAAMGGLSRNPPDQNLDVRIDSNELQWGGLN